MSLLTRLWAALRPHKALFLPSEYPLDILPEIPTRALIIKKINGQWAYLAEAKNVAAPHFVQLSQILNYAWTNKRENAVQFKSLSSAEYVRDNTPLKNERIYIKAVATKEDNNVSSNV